ncbi:putative NADH dehydrogenase/NAD(P)H nitroreductase [Thermoclostridium stercorarium subsp. stercorarium DSM 8532]|jgi:nitroreductase|uniref:Nitroreductase n=3 Tax=Thermoclostridium stercorarium TaxID=1510 RepID=A0A1B1YN61_THEST|nr:nitroreductase family protein [Thermoclostridium stercorarium]AGC69276.1 putative NADH dehydrogenase/NAD(P)H nitroreductase [Thermoclostridium stercorarium subsp. stercorarium DSM 8532]AGI40243.1 nitroreductase [Thermoclostridium stercorarium subsp. stercorarium DSM 8532]ANW99545.1 nitroreductase [Thermoclostridium stercorarium subsp. thermolacticum DSM 2910]ANX02172.1 nitroreductase [Thermoclostridium stercorarium subsp. leptospartum DSM 9219]UZQ85242.1 nitroreductase family protein [Therm
MDFFDVINRRYSVRSYLPDEVEAEKIQKILEAARLAPTACNLQAFKVVVAKTEGRKEEIRKIYPRGWFAEAPYIIAVCAEKGKGWVRSDQKSFADVDATIVMDHIILAATALGLGTCWIGAFDPKAAAEVLELGNNLEPIVLTPLGYPKGEQTPRRRKALEELVIYR